MASDKLDYKALGQPVNPWGAKTAAAFSKLAGLRGISNTCYWDDENRTYVCNGERVGESIEGAYAWLNSQPGVKP